MTHSDKHNNFFVRMRNAKFREYSFKHKNEHNSDIKRDEIGGVPMNFFAECLGNIIKL